MSDYRERERKIDVEHLTLEQADALSVQIGQEIAKIMDDANNKCNRLLNIYGLATKIGYKIVKLSEMTEEKPKKQKRNKKQQKEQSLEQHG